MNEHLPECIYSPGQPGFGGINSGIDSTQPYLPPSPCICPELRACEQRMLRDVAQKAELTFRSDIINPVRDIVEPLLEDQ